MSKVSKDHAIKHIDRNWDAYKKIWIGLLAIGYVNFFVGMGISQYFYGSVFALESGPIWLYVYSVGILVVTLLVPFAILMVTVGLAMLYIALKSGVEGVQEVISDE